EELTGLAARRRRGPVELGEERGIRQKVADGRDDEVAARRRREVAEGAKEALRRLRGAPRLRAAEDLPRLRLRRRGAELVAARLVEPGDPDEAGAAPEADEGVLAHLGDDPLEVLGPRPRAGGIGRRAGDAEELERAVDGAAAEDAGRLRRRATLVRG